MKKEDLVYSVQVQEASPSGSSRPVGGSGKVRGGKSKSVSFLEKGKRVSPSGKGSGSSTGGSGFGRSGSGSGSGSPAVNAANAKTIGRVQAGSMHHALRW